MASKRSSLRNFSENTEDSLKSDGGSWGRAPRPYGQLQGGHDPKDPKKKICEVQRNRLYRVGLNLFNKKPEEGILYLIHQGFLEDFPKVVAHFLISRKELSKQMIGEYLGNLQSPFNMAVLKFFVQDLDLTGMEVDVALRMFQTYFRLPSKAKKIKRLMEVFSHRFVECNRDIVAKFSNPDTVCVLASAIIRLNTDLHNPKMVARKSMNVKDFIKNLRRVDDDKDLDHVILTGIYERIKVNELKPGSDHVTQVLKVQENIVGKKPNLALPHRRLVSCYWLDEVIYVCKKEKPGVYQRKVFLFNDMLMVTKIFSTEKNSVTYTFQQSFPLCEMTVMLFEAPYYPHGIFLSQRVDNKVLMIFNARNEHDRTKFFRDLKESILEMDEMENLRIESELKDQKQVRQRGSENRDSMEILPPTWSGVNLTEAGYSTGAAGGPENDKSSLLLSADGAVHHASTASLTRSDLSNFRLDLQEQKISKPLRGGSTGSLDCGMSNSFQSSAASTVIRDSSPQKLPAFKLSIPRLAVSHNVMSEDGATCSSSLAASGATVPFKFSASASPERPRKTLREEAAQH